MLAFQRMMEVSLHDTRKKDNRGRAELFNWVEILEGGPDLLYLAGLHVTNGALQIIQLKDMIKLLLD